MSKRILFECPKVKFAEGLSGKIRICPIIELTKGNNITQYIAVKNPSEPGVHLITIENEKGKDGKIKTKETEIYLPEERLLTNSLNGKPHYGITGEGGITWRSQL